jgi:hypothetical protein
MENVMLKTQEAGDASPSAPTLHSCVILVGGIGAVFRDIALEHLLRQQSAQTVRIYVVDVSPDGDLHEQLGQTRRPDFVRIELKSVRATGADEEVYRALNLLLRDYDPSVRPGQVVTDLPPSTFPLVAAACRELTGEWFYGCGPKRKAEEWHYARLTPPHADGDLASPWPTQNTLKDFLGCVVGRRFQRRPTALVVGGRALRETFAGRLAGSGASGLSFIQLADTSARPKEVWRRDAGPDLVFCDKKFYSGREGVWPQAAWVVSDRDDSPDSDSPALVYDFGASPGKGARATLPEVVVSWTRRDPEYVTPLWVTNPLARSGHCLQAAKHYQPTPELDELRRAWSDGEPKVWVLTGESGCGKTSLVQRFLEECRPTAGEDGARHEYGLPSADALFVWDFYANPYSEKFLTCFAEYVSTAGGAAAGEEGWLGRIRAGLHSRNLRRVLVVLDGLETIQKSEDGALIDSLVAELLEETAAGRLPLTVVVTTRRAAALRARQGEGHFVARLGPLPTDAACDLMRAYGLRGEVAQLAALAERFGRHALTLAQLCHILCDGYGGDFEAVRGRLYPRLETAASTADAVEAGGAEPTLIARLVPLYEELLPAPEMGILKCLAASGQPLTAHEFAQMFTHAVGATHHAEPVAGLTTEEVQSRFEKLRGRELVTAHAGAGAGAKLRYAVHPTLSRHFNERLAADALEALNLDAMSYYQRRLGAMLESQDASGGFTQGTVSTRRVVVGSRESRRSYPTNPAVLDMMEKIVFHAARAGRLREARDYYEVQMGGAGHLSAVGQRTRALRIGTWLPA